MSENLNGQKICPACGKENELVARFCKFCGINMSTYDSQTVENSQTVEISQTMRFRRNGWSICCVIFIGLLLYFTLVVIPNQLNNFAGALMSGLLLPLVGGASFIGLLYILWIYRGAKFRRIFSISHEGIKIAVPREPLFEVLWSKFDLIHLYKYSGSQNQKYYRFYFISNGVVYDEFTIAGSMHFSGRNCRAIVFQLKQYAEKMNVNFTRGKRIKY